VSVSFFFFSMLFPLRHPPPLVIRFYPGFLMRVREETPSPFFSEGRCHSPVFFPGGLSCLRFFVFGFAFGFPPCPRRSRALTRGVSPPTSGFSFLGFSKNACQFLFAPPDPIFPPFFSLRIFFSVRFFFSAVTFLPVAGLGWHQATACPVFSSFPLNLFSYPWISPSHEIELFFRTPPPGVPDF